MPFHIVWRISKWSAYPYQFISEMWLLNQFVGVQCMNNCANILYNSKFYQNTVVENALKPITCIQEGENYSKINGQ